MERLGEAWCASRARRWEALCQLGPAVLEAATRAVAVMQSLLHQVAERRRERRRQAVGQRHEREGSVQPSRGPQSGDVALLL